MNDHADLFLRIRARHGHYCAMSTLGGRMGVAALTALGEEGAALSAVYRIDTCAADGIAEATGYVPAVKNEGRHRLELRDGCGHGVAVELTSTALEQAAACRRRLDAGEDADTVLEPLRAASAEELMTLMPLAAEGYDA